MDKQTGWREAAIHNSAGCMKEFLSSRVELALERVSHNPEYMELCRSQEEGERTVAFLLEKLAKEERIVIRRHYEDDTAKKGYELDEAYIQGLRDGIRFLLYLDLFQVKGWWRE